MQMAVTECSDFLKTVVEQETAVGYVTAGVKSLSRREGVSLEPREGDTCFDRI